MADIPKLELAVRNGISRRLIRLTNAIVYGHLVEQAGAWTLRDAPAAPEANV